MRPRILVTPDFQDGRYFLGRPYADAVLAAGGLPMIVAWGTPIDELLSLGSGLVVTGGAFDIAPESYGEERRNVSGPEKPERTAFERELLSAALERDLPTLGVCGGMQLLAVVRGGTLHQDIRTDVPGAMEHEQKTPKDLPWHRIEVEPGSRVGRAAAEGKGDVNSTHHQAVKTPGRGLSITARAEDGVVEAIEDLSARFVVGVQWHPEALLASAPWNLGVYRQLVEAARATP